MSDLSEVDACTIDNIEVAICIKHKCMEEVIGQDLSPSFDCELGIVGTWGRKQQVQAQMNSEEHNIASLSGHNTLRLLACAKNKQTKKTIQSSHMAQYKKIYISFTVK